VFFCLQVTVLHKVPLRNFQTNLHEISLIFRLRGLSDSKINRNGLYALLYTVPTRAAFHVQIGLSLIKINAIKISQLIFKISATIAYSLSKINLNVFGYFQISATIGKSFSKLNFILQLDRFSFSGGKFNLYENRFFNQFYQPK